jgi:hypothetical protein
MTVAGTWRPSPNTHTNAGHTQEETNNGGNPEADA